MRLTRLQLDSFRNYSSLDLSFDSGINIIYGNNAEGKTNILESVFLLATGRSHRGARDQDLIRWGSEGFRVRGWFERLSGSGKLEIACRTGCRKALRINGKPENRLSALIGRLNVVLFSPEDLALLKGPPSNRRRLLDIQNSQVSPPYFHHLQEYHRALQQRNALLRDPGPKKDAFLEIWDQPLAAHGASLILRRAAAVRNMAPRAAAFHSFLSDGREEMTIHYQNSLLDKNPELDSSSAHTATEALTEAFCRELCRRRSEEFARRATVIGPHRDDLTVMIGGRDARLYASQGQQRTAVLAIKMAELSFVADLAGENPLLLLDDVTSELDHGRRRFLLEGVSGSVQTFLTTTALDDLDPKWIERAACFRVRSGVVNPA